MQLTTYLKMLYKLIWYNFHFQASKIIPNKSNENIFWEWLLDCLNDIRRNGWRNKMQFGFGLRWAKLIKDLPHEISDSDWKQINHKMWQQFWSFFLYMYLDFVTLNALWSRRHTIFWTNLCSKTKKNHWPIWDILYFNLAAT